MKYLVAIKIHREVFEFDSEKDRQDFLNDLKKFETKLEYATSEVE